MRLSIIIPVYNVGFLVSKCLESCLQQDLDVNDYEILVVNDGSQDNSIGLVRAIVESNISKGRVNNIRIIDRDNGGLSAARNTGLKEAYGEYVWFVDGDDWIEPNVLNDLMDVVYRDNLDVLCFGFQLAFQDGHVEQRRIPHDEKGGVFIGADFLCKVHMPPAAWCALFRKDYLEKNRLFFYEGILHEDQEFTPRAYCMANRISYVDDVIYNYYQREGGIMKSKNAVRKCKDLITVADSLFSFIQANRDRMHQRAYWTMINHVSFAFSQSVANYSYHLFKLEEYKKKPYYPLNINPLLSSKDKWKYRLINISLDLYLIVYRLI